MSEETNNVRVTNATSFFRNQPARRRAQSVAQRSKMNTWQLSDVSRGLSADTAEELTAQLERLASPESMPDVTSVEDLRNWSNTRNGCRLGDLVVTNAPVYCTGCLTNSEEMKKLASTRKGYTQLPTHMRWGAHGLTFGSVYLKTFRGTEANGRSFVKEVKLFVACNNCLDLWVGPIAEGGVRQTSLWPFPVYVPRTNQPRHQSKRTPQTRKEKPKERLPNVQNEALRFVVRSVQSAVSPAGKTRDPWKKVTVTMLTSYLKSEGLEPKKLKPELLSQFSKHLKAQGLNDVLEAVTSAVNSDSN